MWRTVPGTWQIRPISPSPRSPLRCSTPITNSSCSFLHFCFWCRSGPSNVFFSFLFCAPESWHLCSNNPWPYNRHYSTMQAFFWCKARTMGANAARCSWHLLSSRICMRFVMYALGGLTRKTKVRNFSATTPRRKLKHTEYILPQWEGCMEEEA